MIMENLKNLQETNLLSLSDYGLQPVMSLSEINTALRDLEERVGSDLFRTTAKNVYYNLDRMRPGSRFDYRKHFLDDKGAIFLVVSHRYIVDHPDYEFANDYSFIRRTGSSGIRALRDKLERRKLKAAETENNIE